MIEYRIRVEQEDIPVRGNIIDSGDPAYDRRVENGILRRLDAGDVWAWALVTVECVVDGLVLGRSSLGGCSYKNERDFIRSSGHYDYLKAEALAEARAHAEKVCAAFAPVAE